MPRSSKSTAGQPRKSSGSHAVVLVHGILGQNILYWNFIKRYLEGDRNHFHEIRLPFWGFGDLRKSAAHLGSEIDKVLQECAKTTGETKVDLIAHSAGGLAARYYIKNLGGDRRVHSLVTLGTPHHGTLTSLLFPLNPVARQTLPDSPFLRDLNKGPDTDRDLHYVSIYTKTDGVVIPADSARLDGAHNVEIPFTTHWGFLWRREVYKHIREAIDHEAGEYPYYGRARPKPRPKSKARTRSRRF